MAAKGDLLQALLDRQRREKALATAPVPVSTPATTSAVETSKAVAPAPAATPTPTASPTPAPSNLVNIAQTGHSADKSAGLLDWQPKGIHLSYKEVAIGLVVAIGLILGSFFIGIQFGAHPGGQAEKLDLSTVKISNPPSCKAFSEKGKFTVQALALPKTLENYNYLIEVKSTLEKLKLVVKDLEYPGEKIALLVGSADSADDKSLLKLRDWFRELPGADKTSRPLKGASIREVPKMLDK